MGTRSIYRFENVGNELYIDGKKVIRAFESYSGWYWFATELVQTQDSIIEDGKARK